MLIPMCHMPSNHYGRIWDSKRHSQEQSRCVYPNASALYQMMTKKQTRGTQAQGLAEKGQGLS